MLGPWHPIVPIAGLPPCIPLCHPFPRQAKRTTVKYAHPLPVFSAEVQKDHRGVGGEEDKNKGRMEFLAGERIYARVC